MEKDGMNIQWYPGHMTKTRRMIAEQMKYMDAVCEILDARVPLSSRNPDVEELTAGKPRLMVLNRVDLADPAATKAWGAWFRGRGFAVLECNAKQGQGTRQFPAAVRSLLADKLAAYAEKGQADAPGDDPGHPKRGEVHLHQSGGEAEDREDGGPSRRHPCQTVGPGGPEP